MNILVTGSNGQLGNEMRTLASGSANRWLFTDVTVVEGVETIPLDITDKDAVESICSDYSIDCIVNCAAYTNVDKAEDEEKLAYRINAYAVGLLAEAAAARGALLIHISTDYVFKGINVRPYIEDQPTDPLGVYGRTKLAGEKALCESGCRFIILRTAWLYSPYGNNFVKTIRRLTSERDSINVVFDQVGSPTYAADLAFAIFDIIENDKSQGCEGIYHFSNEGVCSWYDFAVATARLSGNDRCVISPCHSDEFPSKVRRPAFSVLDKTKYKKTFNRTVPYWYDSLKKCIDIMDSE
ncbi:MAG: dTDP-4-dehydrorhamnose reductase [Bacteroidaceae bacterium]|jgi:dTDP-4-dehydrorhamnose reductase|nr:dTDP-4-dehydrorhamnose reductase [Bacteroidaceae bacterium]HPB03903.1 dTDP-4-dehydrorhamnose reductase [Bacteroidaceae bacterium]HQL26404.1 dTDP-4-dehydrorhamnose reductase [Bacteroidaceae bacterium]